MVTHNFPEKYAEILRKFNDKGWDLYLASRNHEEVVIRVEEVRRSDPASELENLSGYPAWPKNYAFGDNEALNPALKEDGYLVQPSIIIPRRGARLVPEFRNIFTGEPEKEELPILAGEKFHFFCFQLLTDEVDAQGEGPPTYMPLDLFIESLDTLKDISGMVD